MRRIDITIIVTMVERDINPLSGDFNFVLLLMRKLTETPKRSNTSREFRTLKNRFFIGIFIFISVIFLFLLFMHAAKKKKKLIFFPTFPWIIFKTLETLIFPNFINRFLVFLIFNKFMN